MRSFLTDRTFDIFLWQLCCGCYDTVMNKEFTEKYTKFMMTHAFNEEVVEIAKAEMMATTQDSLSAPLRPSTYIDLFKSDEVA